MAGIPTVELPTEIERRWDERRRRYARITESADHALVASHGVSLNEYYALVALAYSNDGGHLRQQVLAEAIPLNQSSVSRLVGRLDRAGYTERYLCASDRRGVYTQITPAGRELVAVARLTYLRILQDAEIS